MATLWINTFPNFNVALEGYSIQQCLIALIEKLKAVHSGKYFGALLTDLSKALIVFLKSYF